MVLPEAQKAFKEQFGTELELIFAEPDGTLLKPKGGSLYILRHSHGSHLLAAGTELPAVSSDSLTVQS